MPAQMMTHNQYEEFLKEQANIAWKSVFKITKENVKNEKVTPRQELQIKAIWDNFNHITNGIEISPFDLSEYKLVSDEIKKWITAYFSSEKTDRNGNRMFTGFLPNGGLYLLANRLQLTAGYISYGGYYFSDELQITLSFAEGDLFLNLFNNKADYDKEILGLVKFYEEN